MQGEEYQFLLWQLLRGVEHLHQHEVLHRDIKPSNILVRCPPLLVRAPVRREMAGQGTFLDDACWGQDGAVDTLAARLQRLSSVFTVCLGDLGSVAPADPASRPQPSQDKGLSVVTLWYRAPEICLGDVRYSCPADIWALGCVFAEVLVAAPVFQANSVVSLLFKVLVALGTPEPGAYLSELPLFKATLPKFKAHFGGLPCDGVQGVCPELAAMLKGFFMLDPRRRLTAQQGAASHYFGDLRGGSRLTPIASVVLAGRGPFSWVQGRVDDTVLKWIQADPHWKVMVGQIRKGERKTGSQCFLEMEKRSSTRKGAMRTTTRQAARRATPWTAVARRPPCASPPSCVRSGKRTCSAWWG